MSKFLFTHNLLSFLMCILLNSFYESHSAKQLTFIHLKTESNMGLENIV